LIARSHRRSDLRVNVISAVNDAALYGMREHQRNPGARRNGYNVLLFGGEGRSLCGSCANKGTAASEITLSKTARANMFWSVGKRLEG